MPSLKWVCGFCWPIFFFDDLASMVPDLAPGCESVYAVYKYMDLVLFDHMDLSILPNHCICRKFMHLSFGICCFDMHSCLGI